MFVDEDRSTVDEREHPAACALVALQLSLNIQQFSGAVRTLQSLADRGTEWQSE